MASFHIKGRPAQRGDVPPCCLQDRGGALREDEKEAEWVIPDPVHRQ